MNIIERVRAAQQEREHQQNLKVEEQRKQAERRKAEEEKRFREVAKRNNQVLCLVGAEGTLREINKKLLRGRGIVKVEPTKVATVRQCWGGEG